MKNSKDRNIIRLLIVFILYYVVSYYFPNLTTSKVLNLFIKDIVLLISFVIIYFKELRIDFGKFKRSKDKWKVILWVLAIYAAIIAINYIAKTYLPNMININEGDKNNLAIKELYVMSKVYAFFKAVIFTAIAEVILYSLSFRKVITNNIVFIVISSLVYTYFNYLFVGFSTSLLIAALVNRFIPYCLYNIAYIKSKNVFYLISISAIINAVAFVILVLG